MGLSLLVVVAALGGGLVLDQGVLLAFGLGGRFDRDEGGRRLEGGLQLLERR
jgi:hypothetical protein